MSLTLQQCKDKVATNHGFDDWEDVLHCQEPFKLEINEYMDEAAELYRQSAVDELQKEIDQRNNYYEDKLESCQRVKDADYEEIELLRKTIEILRNSKTA